jgi:peptidylprolyl isomerase
MRIWITAALACALALPLAAQDTPEALPSPNAIVNSAPGEDWLVIEAEDLLVMTLAPDAEGTARKVVIQLMPAPFSQGWIDNIRTLARAQWYDGISVNRVQDNYVVQWGDFNYDNPESEGETRPLPEGLKVMDEEDYRSSLPAGVLPKTDGEREFQVIAEAILAAQKETGTNFGFISNPAHSPDNYASHNLHWAGWPLGSDGRSAWPTHCYGMVGVGRNYSPDTGTGAELYTVIGHAPRHLDRNIALVGRVIDGIEHLSSLPRGTGELGFYSNEEADKRVPILSIRVASDLPEEERPQFEYLSTESDSFARYAKARANRQDDFFIHPAGGADICNIPVPIRPFEYVD